MNSYTFECELDFIDELVIELRKSGYSATSELDNGNIILCTDAPQSVLTQMDGKHGNPYFAVTDIVTGWCNVKLVKRNR